MRAKTVCGIIAGQLAVMALCIGCYTITIPDVAIKPKPPVTVTTTTTTTTTTTIPPVASAYGRAVDCPSWARGGECPTPSGLDIRYDVAADGDYTFAGTLLAPHTIITRNADGSYALTFPDFTKDGIAFHCEAWNFPSSSSPKMKGNSCSAYDKSGAFRFWIQCYEVAK